jgi:hypothetical protein
MYAQDTRLHVLCTRMHAYTHAHNHHQGDEQEPERDLGVVKAFRGLGARPNGKAVQSDSAMTVSLFALAP